MDIKTILVPIEAADYREGLLNAALTMGKLMDSYIEGCAVAPPLMDLAGVGAMGGLAIPVPESEPVAADELRGPFLGFMRQHDVEEVGEPQPRLSCGWHDRLLGDDQFGEYARLFDLVVAGRPTSDRLSSPRLETVECCLFEGARPVLIVPPGGLDSLERTVVVAWNRSTEAARAVSFAMALLKAAHRVVVLTVEGGTVAGPSGAQLCTLLHAHDVKAEELTVPAWDMKTGEAILYHAADLKADLLVKGAYTQSRLRQRIFGGATSHLLYHADLPMLMAG